MGSTKPPQRYLPPFARRRPLQGARRTKTTEELEDAAEKSHQKEMKRQQQEYLAKNHLPPFARKRDLDKQPRRTSPPPEDLGVESLQKARNKATQEAEKATKEVQNARNEAELKARAAEKVAAKAAEKAEAAAAKAGVAEAALAEKKAAEQAEAELEDFRKGLEEMNWNDLRSYAKQQGIDFSVHRNKAAILKALMEQQREGLEG